MEEIVPPGVIKNAIERLKNRPPEGLAARLIERVKKIFKSPSGGEEEVVQISEIARDKLIRGSFGPGGVQISFLKEGTTDQASVVLNLVVDGEGNCWLLSNRVGGDGKEKNYRLLVPEEGLRISSEGLAPNLLATMGLSGLTDEDIALQVVSDDQGRRELWVLDVKALESDQSSSPLSERVIVSPLEKIPDRARTAEEPPYDFSDSILTPPTLFRAEGKTETWILVSFDSQKHDHLLLAKIVADGSLSTKSYPIDDFLTENKISKKAVEARIQKWRYLYRKKKWTYGGEIDGMVVLFRSSKGGLRIARLPVDDFERLRQEQGLNKHLEGRRKEESRTQALLSRKKQTEKLTISESSEENIIYYDGPVRILPDIHAGYEEGEPWGNFLDDLSPDEIAVLQELIDRGVKPWEVIVKAMKLVREGKAYYVFGNHEIMFLAGMAGDLRSLANWLGEGGARMLSELGYQISYPDGFDEYNHPRNYWRTEPPLERIMEDLRNIMKGSDDSDSPLKKLKDFFDFLVEHGRTYLIINGVLVVHAGVPVALDGRLEKSTLPGYEHLKGLNLLDQMQQNLRSGDLEKIKGLNAGNENSNPFWLRESFINAVVRPYSMSRLREELNQQLAERRSSATVELVVVGHTPDMGGIRGATISFVRPRVVFIDRGFYQTGKQYYIRCMRKEGEKMMDVFLVDPDGQTEYFGAYPIGA